MKNKIITFVLDLFKNSDKEEQAGIFAQVKIYRSTSARVFEFIVGIIRKTKCFRILERNAIISKTKRNFSRLYPTPQKIKKNRPASPERNTFEGS